MKKNVRKILAFGLVLAIFVQTVSVNAEEGGFVDEEAFIDEIGNQSNEIVLDIESSQENSNDSEIIMPDENIQEIYNDDFCDSVSGGGKKKVILFQKKIKK